MIQDDDEVIDFLAGVGPHAFLKAIVPLPDGNMEEVLVRNSCYHIMHGRKQDVL
jgi:hypothetical protein